tara:strand:- start:10056 stop:10709 length:654 start_codon:yes stop_codon:yes gene_type:complete
MIKHGTKPVDTIFVHCTATQPEWMEDAPLSSKVEEINRWHKQRGFNRIGYHWVIDRNGEVAKGRAENEVGAHVKDYNTGSIGISLVGGFGSNENDPFEKNFTVEQDKALRSLINGVKTRTAITKIRGHNEVAAKACPGFNVSRWLNRAPPAPALSESTTMQAGAVQMLSGAAGGVTALSALEGNVQLVVIAICVITMLAAAWIMRERIKRWARDNAS